MWYSGKENGLQSSPTWANELYHRLAVWPLKGYLVIQVTFLIPKIGIIRAYISQCCT